MQNFIFVDETLDYNLSHTYELSIQVNLNGLSFCILDTVRNKYIALKHQNFSKDSDIDSIITEIEGLLAGDEFLSKKYKSVKLIWLSQKNTLIPNLFFSKENLKTYFEYNFKLDELDEIHFSKLSFIDAYSVYAIPNTIATVFTKHFSSVKFYNQQVPFLNYIFLKHHSEQSKVFVNINNGSLDIVILEKGKLLFNNSFAFKKDSDINYYIILIFVQFKLNREVNELILSGFIDRKTSTFKNLQKFIKHIKFEKIIEEYTFSYTFDKIPDHTFTTLFNLHTCE